MPVIFFSEKPLSQAVTIPIYSYITELVLPDKVSDISLYLY